MQNNSDCVVNHVNVPGKALLFGEYGLLHGGLGIVLTIPSVSLNLRLSKKLGPFSFSVDSEFLRTSLGHELQLTSADLRDFLSNGLSFEQSEGLLSFLPAQPWLATQEKNRRFFLACLAPFALRMPDFWDYCWRLEIPVAFAPRLGLGSSSAIVAGVHFLLNEFCGAHATSMTANGDADCSLNQRDAAVRHFPGLLESLCLIQHKASGYDVLVQYGAINETNPQLFEVTCVAPAGPRLVVHSHVWKNWASERAVRNLAFGICSTNVYSDTSAVVAGSPLSQESGKMLALQHSKLAEKWLSADFSLAVLGELQEASMELAKQHGLLNGPEDFCNAVALAKNRQLKCKTMGAGKGDSLFVSGNAAAVCEVADVFCSATVEF